MSGTNAGTGEPIAFRCWAERRGVGLDHVTTLTGRQRPHHRRGQGIRTMRTAHEYRCSCGHVGWSAHVDVLRVYTRTERVTSL